MLYGILWTAGSGVRGAGGFPEKLRKTLEMGDKTELNTRLPASSRRPWVHSHFPGRRLCVPLLRVLICLSPKYAR